MTFATDWISARSRVCGRQDPACPQGAFESERHDRLRVPVMSLPVFDEMNRVS